MNLFLLYSIWVLDSIQYKKRQKFRKINGLQIYGGVAQLGERHTGSVEVIGSIPTVSTNNRGTKKFRFSVVFII